MLSALDVLKNAGFVPPEVEALRSVDELVQVVADQAGSPY